MDLEKAKKVFGGADTSENRPDFLDKKDSVVYSQGRRSFDDVRKVIMRTDKKKFIWGPRFDEKKLDLNFDSDPLKKGFSFFSIGLFAFSMIVMVFAMVYAYYSFTTGGFSVRQDRIILELDIPTFTAAGQDINGQIVIGNENRTIFKEAFATLEVEGEEDGPAKVVNQIQIGDVDVGDKLVKNISLNLSGLEGQEKIVKVVLYYRVPQSESTFQKTITQKVLITKSPVVMSITGPAELSVAQDGEYLVTVRGISKIIPALLLTLDIPKHMRILSTNFPEVAKGVYNLGPMDEGEERVFKFVGSFLDGPELAERSTIKVKAGRGSENETQAYFSESTYGIVLSKNPVSIFFVGQSDQRGEKITFTGRQPKINLILQNNSGSRVRDAEIQFKFSGGLVDSKSILVEGAVYNASNMTATVSSASKEELREIDPGSQIIFPITFSKLLDETNTQGRNIKIEVTLTSRIEDNEGKPIVQRVSTTMSPAEGSTASLSTYHFSGAFKNFGPMPPQIGSSTTYTVNLTVDTNQGFTNGNFTLPLPANVEFVKALDNTVAYNKAAKVITWNIGTLNKSTTTAFGIAKRETSIQLSILPSPSQVRTAPLLSNGAKFEAITKDKEKRNFTIPVNDTTINIQSDPKYQSNKGYDSVSE